MATHLVLENMSNMPNMGKTILKVLSYVHPSFAQYFHFNLDLKDSNLIYESLETNDISITRTIDLDRIGSEICKKSLSLLYYAHLHLVFYSSMTFGSCYISFFPSCVNDSPLCDNHINKTTQLFSVKVNDTTNTWENQKNIWEFWQQGQKYWPREAAKVKVKKSSSAF